MCPQFAHNKGSICSMFLILSYFGGGEVILFFLSGKIGVLTNSGKI